MTVSIVIPCFDYAPYLSSAIESALSQAWPDLEVIVVDDGSTDGSADVAARYPDVRLLRQPNRGVGSARNAGLAASAGGVLIFLDADDRLRPGAVGAAVRAFEAHPDAMLAVGGCAVLGPDGHLRPGRVDVPGPLYDTLLQSNPIWMPAMAAYRRAVFRDVGLFDTRDGAAADYDMYLRIARRHEVTVYDAVVAEYRQHDRNMSRDPVRMLEATLAVLRRQRAFVAGGTRRSYREGLRRWRAFYGERLFAQWREAARAGAAPRALARDAIRLLRLYPRGVVYHGWRTLARRLKAPERRNIRPSSACEGGRST